MSEIDLKERIKQLEEIELRVNKRIISPIYHINYSNNLIYKRIKIIPKKMSIKNCSSITYWMNNRNYYYFYAKCYE